MKLLITGGVTGIERVTSQVDNRRVMLQERVRKAYGYIGDVYG
jgi:hypothetical protein